MKIKLKILCALMALLMVAGTLCACNTDPPSDGTGESLPATELPTEAPPAQEIPENVCLVENGIARFKIVKYDRRSSLVLEEAALTIQEEIRKKTVTESTPDGVKPEIVAPKDCVQGERYIVIGECSAIPAMTNALNALPYGTYGYRYDGNCILIVGHSDTMMEKALNAFIGSFSNKKKSDTIQIPSVKLSNFEDWLTDVPVVEGIEPSGILNCGDNTFLVNFRNIGKERYEQYLSGMKNSAYRLVQEKELDNNQYKTYRTENGQILVTWYGASKEMRLTCQNFRSTVPADLAATAPTEKLTEPKLAVMSLNYSKNVSDLTDAGGLSLVFTLEDGRYVIVDGGYSNDANGLYNYLKDKNVRKDGIVIAAWILTHSHGDHMGCFEAFSAAYGTKVTCQSIVSNSYPVGAPMALETDNGKLSSVPLLSKRFGNQTAYIKPHAGQSLYFGNMEVEMLFTHEELFPGRPQYVNETSLVFRVHLGGQTILVTADAELTAIATLNRLYKTALQSDILQINHHGYSDINAGFFSKVGARIAIWPTSRQTVDKRNRADWRNGLYMDLVAGMDRYFVADDVVEILTLPYAATDPPELYTMNF